MYFTTVSDLLRQFLVRFLEGKCTGEVFCLTHPQSTPGASGVRFGPWIQNLYGDAKVAIATLLLCIFLPFQTCLDVIIEKYIPNMWIIPVNVLCIYLITHARIV